ncbi:MAG: sulfurtransferase-like selenium metabolism protein YedF [Dehalococcoidia bacterium]|nr:sulfurtransferase-like selenium metabolism protein YedF [Dehalococcoidia bacterium]
MEGLHAGELARSRPVVLVSSDRLGTGDRRLGRILMKSFLNTVWDTENRPERIIFLNSAVRLTTEGSDVLDALALLERDGVELLSCGTCLEYYGIKDRLKAGRVTNMREIADTLFTASRVIRV